MNSTKNALNLYDVFVTHLFKLFCMKDIFKELLQCHLSFSFNDQYRPFQIRLHGSPEFKMNVLVSNSTKAQLDYVSHEWHPCFVLNKHVVHFKLWFLQDVLCSWPFEGFIVPLIHHSLCYIFLSWIHSHQGTNTSVFAFILSLIIVIITWISHVVHATWWWRAINVMLCYIPLQFLKLSHSWFLIFVYCSSIAFQFLAIKLSSKHCFFWGLFCQLVHSCPMLVLSFGY